MQMSTCGCAPKPQLLAQVLNSLVVQVLYTPVVQVLYSLVVQSSSRHSSLVHLSPVVLIPTPPYLVKLFLVEVIHTTHAFPLVSPF